MVDEWIVRASLFLIGSLLLLLFYEVAGIFHKTVGDRKEDVEASGGCLGNWQVWIIFLCSSFSTLPPPVCVLLQLSASISFLYYFLTGFEPLRNLECLFIAFDEIDATVKGRQTFGLEQNHDRNRATIITFNILDTFYEGHFLTLTSIQRLIS
ncbi:unnamed protein product [Lactuca saligna]|uniref:Uncharacterized protein n=1 Tax=Lactuca saligna TaxID=75948 RepID=A0AA35Z4Q4_LACSI|nr:unnamed protein product [Lactuca saligna]